MMLNLSSGVGFFGLVSLAGESICEVRERWLGWPNSVIDCKRLSKSNCNVMIYQRQEMKSIVELIIIFLINVEGISRWCNF